MKKIIFFILLPILGISQNSNLDKKNGWAHFKFGTPPSHYENLALEMEEKNTKLYSIDQTKINIDGIDFEYIQLTFHFNKLVTISLKTKNAMEDKFLKILKENFGSPIKSNLSEKVYEWSTQKILLTFADNGFFKDATVDFYYKESSKK
jgi:hypothetical protein